MKTEVMTVTPELAEKWLINNRHNRKIRKSHIASLSAALKRGEWLLTHQGIAFDASGNLIDGQHRLEAIAKTKISAVMMVTVGADPAVYSAIDIGATRSFADVLHIDKRVAEPLRLASKIVFPRGGRPIPTEMMEIDQTIIGEYIREIVDHCGGTRKFFSSAAMKLSAAISMATGSKRDYVLSQYSALVRFDVDSMSDQARAFAKDVHDGRFRSVDQYAVLARGMKVFDQKRSQMKRMRLTPGDILEAVEVSRQVIAELLSNKSPQAFAITAAMEPARKAAR
jgi:hypothetical protein